MLPISIWQRCSFITRDSAGFIMKVHVFNIYLATAINGGKSVGQKRKRDYISDLLNNERRADVCLCIVQTIWLTISLLRITSKKPEEAKTTWQPRPFFTQRIRCKKWASLNAVFLLDSFNNGFMNSVLHFFRWISLFFYAP